MIMIFPLILTRRPSTDWYTLLRPATW